MARLTDLAAAQAKRYVAAWLRGEIPESLNPEVSAPLALRFAVDNLTADYFDAALAGAHRPSSEQLGDWFWNETAAVAAVFALGRVHLISADDRLKAIAGLFVVSGMRLSPMG